MKKLFWLLILTAIPLCSIAAELYDWQKAEKLHDGILHAYIYRNEPRPMKIHAVRVDLKSPGIDFIATPKDKDHGKPMPDFPKLTIQTKRRTVKDFMLLKRSEGHDVLIAVNSTPWSPFCKPYTHVYAGNINLVISDGVVIADKKKSIPAFVLTKDGKIEIRIVKGSESRENFRIALAGFSIILKNGKYATRYKDYHPRTCYGISEDGRYLYLMTVDGRQKFISEGASVIECADLMREFGAYDAINMDGGGSTTLVNWNSKKQKPEILSHQIFGSERRVATSLGIIRKKQ